MKLLNHIYTIALFASFLLLSISCTPKIPDVLKERQELKYSNTWNELKSYPIKRGRTDDLHFFDPMTGFVINSQGYLIYTEDGGESWDIVYENKGTFFRCITFKNRQKGWLGTIGTDDEFLSSKDTVPLYATIDGGKNWEPVKFDGPTPKGLCGLQKVTDNFIVGCGRVRGPSFFIKTNDGGKNWKSYDLNHIAGSLIAPYFFDEMHGLLIGGTTTDKKNCRSLVLETFDGGENWDTVYISEQKGEYCWKFSFPDRDTGYISIQRNVREGDFYHLKTTDGGHTWKAIIHSPEYYYVQGIGFINKQIGWIGGSNNWTYETRDAGQTWSKMIDIGRGFNNFQFFGDTLAYGVGFGVFKSNQNLSKELNTIDKYFENGQLRDSYTLTNGFKEGDYKGFYENGKLKVTGQFKQNLRYGKWSFFDQSGKLLKKVKMKGGVAVVTKKKMRSYLGKYKTEDGTIRSVFEENGQLFSQRGDGRKLIMYPETDNRFFYAFNSRATIEFVSDRDGKVIHSKTFQNGKTTIAQKIE